MHKSDFGFVVKAFLSWRILIFIFAFLAVLVIPVFGARFPYADRVLTITHLPAWIWGFGNFDGVHYLRLAQNGYTADLTQAFFPLYPLLIHLFNFIPKDLTLDTRLFTDPSYFYTGMILTTLFFITALYFLYRLIAESADKKVATLSVLLLLSFPTAFYFGAIYSESLFLLLTVLTFWFTRKNNFLLSGIFAALASATKIQGVLLFVFLVIELIGKYRNRFTKLPKGFWSDLFGVIVSPMGLVFYMLFLQKTVGNPLYFLSAQSSFGAGRSATPFVLLPQVLYRYCKMFLTVPPVSLVFLNTFMEFFITAVLIIVLILAFKKKKFSYWIFSVLAILMPTLTGTLSSMPRYALLAFMVLPFIAVRFRKAVKYIIIVQSLLQIVLLALFIRGYWVA